VKNRHRAAPARSGGLGAAALATLTLAGCSPSLDWHTFNWPAGGFSVLLPARPVEETREVQLAGITLTLHLFSVRVDDRIWAAGYADLPPGLEPARRTALLAEAASAYARNVGAAPEQAAPEVGAPPDERAGASGAQRLGTPDTASLECRRVDAQGQAAGRNMALAARLCASATRYYPLISIGQTAAPAGTVASDIANFLGSLSLR
jgi:hypothetical protein